MPSITELNLETEALDSVDQKAAEEATSFPPKAQPGWHTFIFQGLEKETEKTPYFKKVRGGKEVVEVTYKAAQVRTDGTFGPTIGYNRVDTYKTERMSNSKLGEFLYALGKADAYNADPTLKTADTLLKQAEGAQTTFRGFVVWTAYDKDSGARYSTSPQKGYTKQDGTEVPADLPWPKDGTGAYVRTPEFPNGNQAERRESIERTAPVIKK